MSSIPLISIVGRPNVGKSTLFNRLMGKRLSIVDDMPGVTRDRIFGRCSMGKKAFHLVDTGGLTWAGAKDILDDGVEKQILASMDSSAALIFVVDAAAGITPEDRYVADEVRRRKCPVILVSNKADGPRMDDDIVEAHELGLGEPMPISAQHGRNIDQLKTRIIELLPKDIYDEGEGEAIRFCVVGRPNVGKSSITNAILGEERCVVSPVPGTTRDRVDTEFVYKDEKFIIVDTAGIRRRKMKMDSLEYYSYGRAKGAIKDSDVAVLVLDAEDGLLEGDKRIVSFVQENQKGLIVAVNKMDLVEEPDYDVFLKNTFKSAPFLRNTPFIFVSAMEKAGMPSLLENVTEVHKKLNEMLPLELLKNVIYDTRVIYSPRAVGGRVGEIRDVLHDRTNPPRVVIKVNGVDLFPPDYMRLLENRIRSVFDLTGVPLDLALSAPPKPEPKKKKTPEGLRKKRKPSSSSKYGKR